MIPLKNFEEEEVRCKPLKLDWSRVNWVFGIGSKGSKVVGWSAIFC